MADSSQSSDSNYTPNPSELHDTIDRIGLRAAVKVITRVYEDAMERDSDKPHALFWAPFANASVHVARWTLGHNKDGEPQYPPKLITHKGFKKFVSQLIPPGGSVEALVMDLAHAAVPEMCQILVAQAAQDDVEEAEFEDIEAARETAIDTAIMKAMG